MRGCIRLQALLEFLILFPVILPTGLAALVNVTIDDTYGDTRTGQHPSYLPRTPGIWQDQTCATCVVKPDKSLAFDGTWTAATYKPSLQNINITLSFTGVSVWVFLILANNLNGSTTAANTECNFTMDGALVGTFSHQPDMNDYHLQYNVSVFNQTGLSNSPHQLVISTSGLPYDVFVNFDYAIYTADLPDTVIPTSTGKGSTSVVSPTHTSSSSSSNNNNNNSSIGIIVGSVFGGLAFVILVCAMFLFRRLRKSQKTTTALMAQPILGVNEPPTEGYHDDVTTSVSPAQWQTIAPLSRPDNPGAQWTPPHSSGSNRLLSPPPPPHASGRSPSSPDYASDPTGLRTYQVPTTTRSAKSRDELRTTRQMEINRRLQNAQQEMNALAFRQTAATPDPNESGRLVETEQEMESMREQIRQLTSQIEHLQRDHQSDWAMGLSDEAPPAYS